MLQISSIGDITEVKFETIEKLNILVTGPIKAGLQKLFERPNAKVLVNMKGINFLDSSGFATFLTISKVAGLNNGQLILCNIDHPALDLFKVLQLHTVFNIIHDREEAIKSFK